MQHDQLCAHLIELAADIVQAFLNLQSFQIVALCAHAFCSSSSSFVFREPWIKSDSISSSVQHSQPVPLLVRTKTPYRCGGRAIGSAVQCRRARSTRSACATASSCVMTIFLLVIVRC